MSDCISCDLFDNKVNNISRYGQINTDITCSHRKLHSSQHGQILINMSVSFICLYLGFLVASHATSIPAICGLSAALLHYFMLVYFGWTSVEAFFLYRNLVKVLGSNLPRFVLKAALFVYCKYHFYPVNFEFSQLSCSNTFAHLGHLCWSRTQGILWSK